MTQFLITCGGRDTVSCRKVRGLSAGHRGGTDGGMLGPQQTVVLRGCL